MRLRNLFRRKSDTVVDLSDLQKRGIIKQKAGETSSVVEFTGSDESSDSSPLGFLGSLAGSSDETSAITEHGITTIDSIKKQKLRGILRDMKSNIKNTTDKIYKITDRLDLIEKKLERLERRAGYS